MRITIQQDFDTVEEAHEFLQRLGAGAAALMLNVVPQEIPAILPGAPVAPAPDGKKPRKPRADAGKPRGP